jgi:phage-related baseplate assembly protein
VPKFPNQSLSEATLLELRDLPGLPDPRIDPPITAESGDPFAALRIVHLLARVPRGRPVRVRDIVDRLNADYLDWSFSRPVVLDAIIQLQSNWRADYRTMAGIDLADGAAGEEVTIEHSRRVDPWIVRQVERLAAECRQRLATFARDEGALP